MMLNRLRQDLLQIGFPLPNANGNFEFQITPRTGTLADLLLVSDAGDGEIATATDEDCTVTYRGDPSVGKPTFRSGFSMLTNVIPSISGLAQSVETDVNLVSAVSMPSGLLDATNNWVNVPSYVSGAGSTDIVEVRFKPKFVMYQLSPGAVVTLDLQQFNGSTWASIDSNNKISATAAGNGVAVIRGEQSAVLTAIDVQSLDRFKLVITQDGALTTGATLTASALITISQGTY